MSTAYGYVRMQFTKKDGSADGEIAKKIYRYCTEKFDFFNTPDDDWERYGDAFELNEEIGEIGSAYMGDGLYIKNAARDAYEEDWLQDIYSEFKPYQMKVQILWDYTEFSFDENYITRYMVSEKDDQRTLEEYDRFNFTDGGKFDSDRYHFTRGDADDCYPLLDSDYNECSLMAKNKNTGRVVELGGAAVIANDEGISVYELSDSDGEEVSLFDEESIAAATYDDWYMDEDYLQEGESSDQSDWELYIAVPEENVFFEKPVKPSDLTNAGSSSQPSSPKCPNCGAGLQEGDVFCMKCGTKIEVSADPVCSNCGEKLPQGAAFCMKCGTRVGEVKPELPPAPPAPETPVEPVQPAAPEEPERVLSQLNGKTVFKADDYFDVSELDYNVSYSSTGKNLAINFEVIKNISDWDTASLQTVVYLCPEANGEDLVDFDNNVNGIRIAAFEFNPLKKGFNYSNVQKSIKIPENIKSGKYYVVIAMYELGTEDGKEIFTYFINYWDFNGKLLDYNADALGKKDSMVYKSICLTNLGDFTNFKDKCTFCKKALSGINLISSNSLKPRLGREKSFYFCSVDCGKKWIDTEGSKYRDTVYEQSESFKKRNEKINASK